MQEDGSGEKRRRAAALQDAHARNLTPGEREASWSAPVLWRFGFGVFGSTGGVDENSVEAINSNRIMKKILAIALFAFIFTVFASTEGINGKVITFGQYQAIGQENIIETPNTPSGKSRVPSTGFVFLNATNVIPAKLGVRFGMEYEISNIPEPDGPITVTVIKSHPRMTKPDGSFSQSFKSVEPAFLKSGKIHSKTGYGFEHNYELVTGDWTFELQYDGKSICIQKFTVVSDTK